MSAKPSSTDYLPPREPPAPLHPLQFEPALNYLFSRPTELEKPDKYSRAPQTPIHTSSLVRRR